jgi:hypothetical protein
MVAQVRPPVHEAAERLKCTNLTFEATTLDERAD